MTDVMGRPASFSVAKETVNGPKKTLAAADPGVTCPWLGELRLVFVSRGVEWKNKVTRRFCESASRRATVGQLPRRPHGQLRPQL
jgi:hypothetical protein